MKKLLLKDYLEHQYKNQINLRKLDFSKEIVFETFDKRYKEPIFSILKITNKEKFNNLIGSFKGEEYKGYNRFRFAQGYLYYTLKRNDWKPIMVDSGTFEFGEIDESTKTFFELKNDEINYSFKAVTWKDIMSFCSTTDTMNEKDLAFNKRLVSMYQHWFDILSTNTFETLMENYNVYVSLDEFQQLNDIIVTDKENNLLI